MTGSRHTMAETINAMRAELGHYWPLKLAAHVGWMIGMLLYVIYLFAALEAMTR